MDNVSQRTAILETLRDGMGAIHATFLVIEPEVPEWLSTRKLVLEVHRYNVLTAYSTDEAVEMFRRFPNVSGVIISTPGIDCAKVIGVVKKAKPDLPVVVLTPQGVTDRCPGADHHISSYDPEELLNLLRRMMPDAAAA